MTNIVKWIYNKLFPPVVHPQTKEEEERVLIFQYQYMKQFLRKFMRCLLDYETREVEIEEKVVKTTVDRNPFAGWFFYKRQGLFKCNVYSNQKETFIFSVGGHEHFYWQKKLPFKHFDTIHAIAPLVKQCIEALDIYIIYNP
jgi:hypothetical protein